MTRRSIDTDRELLVIGPVVESQTSAPTRRQRALVDAARANGFSVVWLWAEELDSHWFRRLMVRFIQRGCGNTTPPMVRVVFEMMAGGLSLLYLLLRRPSHVIISLPYVPLAIAALIPARLRKRTQVIVDVRDITWDYLHAGVAGGASRLLAHVYEILARAGLRRCDLVCCTNEMQRQRLLESFGVDADVVANGVDADVREALATVDAQSENRREIRLLYAGTLGYAQSPLRLLGLLSHSDRISLRFVGTGPLQRDVESAAASMDSVSYRPPMGFHELIAEYSAADALVACLAPDPAFSTAIPSKIFEYAASGKPLVFVGPAPTRELVEGLGGLHSTECDEALSQRIEQMVEAVRAGAWQATTAPIPDRTAPAQTLMAKLS